MRWIPTLAACLLLAPAVSAAGQPTEAPPAPAAPPAPKIWRVETARVAGSPNYVFLNQGRPMEIAAFGRERGYLGVELVDMTSELRAYFGAAPDAGVLISAIAEDSPAAQAGLAVGDVVVSIDGEPVDSSFALARAVGRREKGDELQLEVIRDHKTRRLTAVVSERERPQVDVGFMFRSCDEEDEEDCQELVGPPGAAWDFTRPGRIRPLPLDSVHLSEAIRELESRLDSPEWRARVTTFQERIGELEERIRELEKRLDERNGG